MQPPTELDVIRLVDWLEQQHIRYMLIGGHAVRLYGSTRLTYDYDFWFDPDERERVLTYLSEDQHLELSADINDRTRPLVSAVSDIDRVDAFFVRAIATRDGEALDFEVLFARSKTIEDPGGLLFRVPSVSDLIALKSVRQVPRPEDEQDVRFLRVRLQAESNEA